MQLAGLIPGVELVRLGTCEPEEFEQHGDYLLKGPRGTSQVVVKPAPGYEFMFQIISNNYLPVRVFPPRTFSLGFVATSDNDLKVLDNLKKIPGVVGATETTTEQPPAPVAEPEPTAKVGKEVPHAELNAPKA